MPKLTEFRITFGVRYAHERHPGLPAASPDGWLAVMAENEDAARSLVNDRIGNAWAFIYRPDFPGYPTVGRLFPKGELARWTVGEPVVPKRATPDLIDPLVDLPGSYAQLTELVLAAFAIHKPGPSDAAGSYCSHCLNDEGLIFWPCPTAQALGVRA